VRPHGAATARGLRDGLKYGLPILAPLDDEAASPRRPVLRGRTGVRSEPEGERKARRGRRAHGPHGDHPRLPALLALQEPRDLPATKQWFISMDRTGLRRRRLPGSGTSAGSRLGAGADRRMVANRPTGASRASAPGACRSPCSVARGADTTCSTETRRSRGGFFAKEGADAWFDRDVSELLPPGTACPECRGRRSARRPTSSTSGSTRASPTLRLRGKGEPGHPGRPLSRGSDQHRGWFHSSLLAAVGTRGVPPYRGC